MGWRDKIIKILKEGIKFDEDNNAFLFNFENDEDVEFIELINNGLRRSKIYSKCYFYRYEFKDNADSKTRSKFIDYIKFPPKKDDKNIEKFIKNAVDSLNETINLYDFDVIIYPESQSSLTEKVVNYIYKFNHPSCVSFEFIKNMPADIEFDFENFEKLVLNTTIQNKNGKIIQRYNSKQKKEIIDKIKKIMDDIHSKNYFSIARDFKTKPKFRNFIKNFYKFNDKEIKKHFDKLTKSKILIVDDILTSGTTVNFLIQTITNIVSPKHEIVVFTLIGKDHDII